MFFINAYGYLCINLKYKNKSESKIEKRTQGITGSLVLNTYIHHYELALRTTLYSLTYLSTIQMTYLYGLE
jgi:hypothetical protein